MNLPLQDYLVNLHQQFESLRGGQVATYIPELARVDPDQFGICVVATDGYTYAVGDSDALFTIQSISKPFVYAAALADQGREFMLGKIGVEPSGDAFNSISLHPQNGAPLNPMINAGAIAATALVAGEDASAQWQRVESVLSGFAGRPLTVDESVYASESETGFRNRAIAWMLRNAGITSGDPMPALENYFRQCALQVSCRDLATMAATLAHGGINPRTGERVATEEDVQAVLSVMTTCGMYDYAGNWLYTVGMPAKSGVGGGVIAVLPGRFGVAVFSPRLDAIGNSERGIAVCRQFSHDFGLHVFGPHHTQGLVLNRVYTAADAPSRRARPAALRKLLDQQAPRICYLELQGEVALDGAEYVSRRIGELAGSVSYFILDLHRVSAVTPGSARLLEQSRRQWAAQGVTLVLSRVGAKQGVAEAFRKAAQPAGQFWAQFADNDLAVEWCENDILLAQKAVGEVAECFHTPGQFALFAGLQADELKQLDAIVQRVSLPRGTLMMKVGENDNDCVYLVLQGEVSISMPLPDGTQQRLALLGPGAVFGEMALLGRRRRTANVQVEQDTVCLALSASELDQIARTAPQLKIVVLRNLACELAGKLTRANHLIGALAA